MSCLFWLRPAHCVRFTSLRDMSLRRNKPPARAPRAAPAFVKPNVAVMRGLRA
jgi:hypothetical protein